jgi:tripartite-type tricarboxylate transporter receptor subunit TctC
MTTRRSLLGSACAVAGIAAFYPAQAQDAFPTRPVTLVVAWAPGGSSDLVARILAERMSKELGQPVVVDNRPGASGTIGQASVARARADGYTILMSGRGTFAMASHLFPNRGYDDARDFAAIGKLCETPIYLCVSSKLAANSVQELVAMAKQKPGGLNYASSGAGSSAHLATELFLKMADIEVVNVTYRGGSPAVQALISGEVQMAFVDAVTALPLMRDGQLKGLAVGSAERFPLTPDVPTLSESGSGLAGYECASQFSLLAPAGTPDPIIRKLWGAMDASMRDPELVKRLSTAAYIPTIGKPEDFPAYLASETARWGEVIRSRGITLD